MNLNNNQNLKVKFSWALYDWANSAWGTVITTFIFAWIGQFIGHKIEGKKPSFFEDIQFLLIGPAWLLSFVYKKMGIKY